MKDGEIVQIDTPEGLMTNPANHYVERFVEQVDLSKVLTAAHVMRRPETIAVERGPRVALQIMRDKGVSTLYVVDKAQRLIGVITAEGASEAVKQSLALNQIVSEEVPTAHPETLLHELFETVSTTRVPLAVVDENRRLQGIVIRGAVLAALAGNRSIESG
jgi:glycine betaine/proline transport system ATP-binding protein